MFFLWGEIRKRHLLCLLLSPFVVNIDCFILQYLFTKSVKCTANLPLGTIWYYHAFPLPSQLQRWVMISPFITFNKFFYEMPRISVDRKSTRLNSSHVAISYAGFCL